MHIYQMRYQMTTLMINSNLNQNVGPKLSKLISKRSRIFLWVNHQPRRSRLIEIKTDCERDSYFSRHCENETNLKAKLERAERELTEIWPEHDGFGASKQTSKRWRNRCNGRHCYGARTHLQVWSRSNQICHNSSNWQTLSSSRYLPIMTLRKQTGQRHWMRKPFIFFLSTLSAPSG